MARLYKMRKKGIYGNKSVKVYVQTEKAKQKVEDLMETIDLLILNILMMSKMLHYIQFTFTLKIGYDVSILI